MQIRLQEHSHDFSRDECVKSVDELADAMISIRIVSLDAMTARLKLKMNIDGLISHSVYYNIPLALYRDAFRLEIDYGQLGSRSAKVASLEPRTLTTLCHWNVWRTTHSRCCDPKGSFGLSKIICAPNTDLS